MTRVRGRHQKRNKNDWQDEMKISNSHTKDRLEHIKIFLRFKSSCSVHLSWIKGALQRINLSLKDMPSVHSAPYRAAPEVCELKKSGIGKLLELEVVEQTQPQSIEPIFFAPEKRACSDSGFTTQIATQWPCMTSFAFLLWISDSNGWEAWPFSRYGTRTVVTCKLNRQGRLRGNRVFVFSWIISVYLYAIRIDKRTRYIPASHGRHFVYSSLTAHASLLG